MSSKMKSQLVNHLFKMLIEGQHGIQFLHFLQGDCMEKVTNGILALFHAGKENIVYQLARIIADKRMDMERMPFGLTDYNIRFFNANNTVKLKMEEHYSVWQETMFAHFGDKWVSLNRGPMWQYDEEEELKDGDAVPSCDILAEALNSAGLVSKITDKEEELRDSDAVPCCDILAEALNSAGLVAEIIDASDNSEKNVDSDNAPCGDGSELVEEVGSVDTKDDDASCYLSEPSLEDASYSARTTVEARTVVSETREVPDSGCQANVSGTRPVGDRTEFSEEVANDVSAEVSEAVSVSTLWTSITREEAEEILESNVDPSQFERLHGVVPQSHPAKRYSGLYKPEKVCV